MSEVVKSQRRRLTLSAGEEIVLTQDTRTLVKMKSFIILVFSVAVLAGVIADDGNHINTVLV